MVIPAANSTTSIPRRTSPRASSSYLPFSRDDELREILEVALEERLEAEHQAGSLHHRDVRPLLRGRRRGARRRVDRIRSGEGHLRDPLARRRVEDVLQLGSVHRGPAPADHVLHR